MGLIHFIIGVVLLAAGVFCVIYLCRLMLAPLLAILLGSNGSSKIKKAKQKVEKIDELISDGKTQEAIKVLQRSIVYDFAPNTKQVVQIKEHHQNILSRCLIISEEMSSKAENIADVERLFMERSELLSLRIKALDSFKSLENKRQQAGKHIPAWSKDDFQRKISEIKAELARNQSDLEKAADELFKSLGSPNTDNIVYH
jgi:molecular chaperone DnaK (HSP70)